MFSYKDIVENKGKFEFLQVGDFNPNRLVSEGCCLGGTKPAVPHGVIEDEGMPPLKNKKPTDWTSIAYHGVYVKIGEDANGCPVYRMCSESGIGINTNAYKGYIYAEPVCAEDDDTHTPVGNKWFVHYDGEKKNFDYKYPGEYSNPNEPPTGDSDDDCWRNNELLKPRTIVVRCNGKYIKTSSAAFRSMFDE